MKALLVALAVVAAALSIADYRAWRSSLRQLDALAAESDLARWRSDLADDLRRKANPDRARILLTRSLIALEMDRGRLSELSVAERARERRQGRQRLRLARQLALESLARQPVAWQAALALGAARYLEAERGRDHELPIAAWRDPLLTAMRLAPGHPEPPRVLAGTYMSAWSRLTPAERRAVQPVLAAALEDRSNLDLLIGTWVRLAPSLERLLEPIPDAPWAWRRLEIEFRRLGDFERLSLARQRLHAWTAAAMPRQVEEGRARLRGNDRRAGHRILRRALGTTPDLAYAGAVAEALALLPESFREPGLEADLDRWLRWALDLCRIGRCPLDASTIRALSSRLESLDEFERAAAALAAGDADATRLPDCTDDAAARAARDRLRILGAEQHLRRGRLDRASSDLEQVTGGGRDDPNYWRVRGLLAEQQRDPEAASIARARLAELSRRAWTSGWRKRGAAYRLEILPEAPAAGLRIELVGVPEPGAAIEIRWDGRLRDVAAVQPRATLRWRFPVEAGLHLLELEPLHGSVKPGAVALEPDRPAI